MWEATGVLPCCKAVFMSRGITTPYAWQKDFISRAALQENLVFAQPTSAGKTFVVEVLLLRRMLEASRARAPIKALYVVPYQTLAREKAASLQPFADHHDFVVECFQGAQGKLPLAKRTRSVLVATVEKAVRIVASLIAERRMGDLELVVADEVHFLAESGRGPLLEVLLSRIKCHAPRAQIVAMSATLPNIAEVADWLSAAHVTGSARPVELSERIASPDQLLPLVKEATDRKGSVIIFCGTKRRTEQVTQEVRAGLKGVVVAFHHAGLGAEQREAVEEAFRLRGVNVLVATTTLATGVNLPAARVIVNTMMVGNKPLTPVQFKQMAGRAGRSGLDATGDAVLLAWPNRRGAAEALLLGPKEGLHSLVMYEDGGEHLDRAALGFVCAEDGAWAYDVEQYVRYSLLGGLQQSDAEVGSRVRESLSRLEGHGMLRSGEDERLTATDVGWATFVSTLPVGMAKGVLDDLDKARRDGIILIDQLHLLYLITPFEMYQTPDWEVFERVYCGFSETRVQVAERVGVTLQYVKCRANLPGPAREGPELWAAKRLWVALMLQEIVDEGDVHAIAKKYGYDIGGVEDMQSRAAAFGSMITEFAENVGFGDLAGLFEGLHGRVAFGAKRDVMVLCQIPKVGVKRARALVSMGLKSVGDVATADAHDIAARLKATNGLGQHGAGTMVAIVKAARTMMQQELAAVEASCGV